MTGTFDTPWGRLRVQSQRRFILVAERSRYLPEPYIVQRSDSLAKLQRVRRAFGLEACLIMDTETGETVAS